MQHKNERNLTKKHRISAVCRGFIELQLSKTRVHDRFLIGVGHADIKRCDGFAAYRIFAGYIEARYQADMVNGKAGYFFHGILLSETKY